MPLLTTNMLLCTIMSDIRSLEMHNQFVLANSKQTRDEASAAKLHEIKNIVSKNAQNNQTKLSQISRVKRRL